MNSLVSIIVPTKNSSKFLDACLSSIKKQTYTNLELIVVDNNSTDQTKEIAKKYTDKVFNHGPERSAQRNFGVEQSKGEYVLIIDSDMELSDGVVKSCVEKIETDQSIKGIIIPEESFGEGFWAQCKKLERSFYVGEDSIEAARFFPTGLYKELGGYNEALVSGEDWDLSDRAEMKGKIARIGDYIYHNEGRLSITKTLEKKYYYARNASQYMSSLEGIDTAKKRKTGVLKRYGLFFSKPGKLFHNPILGIGMLFMKTCEFGFGAIGMVLKK